MRLFDKLFKIRGAQPEIVGIQSITEEEISTIHKEHNVPVSKLTENLLYDRQWCRKYGIRYYDLATPIGSPSASEIAREFVMDAIKEYRNKVANS